MKRISGFAHYPGKGSTVDLEDRPMAVRVLPREGDVLFSEGAGRDRLDGVCIPGSAVMEFRTEDSAAGTEVSVWFQACDGVDYHVLGTSADGADARSWVDRVNAIYAKRDELKPAAGQAADRRRDLGIVIRDIVGKRNNIVLPGDYVLSAKPNPPRVGPARFSYPGSGFTKTGLPVWQEHYVRYCMDQVVERSGCKGPYRITIGNAPAHEYPWIGDRVKYPSKEFKARITQPLELMFDRTQRHDKIGVNSFAVVRNFAVMYVRKQPTQAALELRSQEPAASTFGKWVSRFSKVTVRGEKLDVCTPLDQSVHYSFKDAVFDGRIELGQHHSAGSLDELKRWIAEHRSRGVVACDIGVAYQIIHDMQRNGDSLASLVDFAIVPYNRPVDAGFCYRVDDPQWASVCGKALSACSESDRNDVAESLSEFREQAKTIGVEVKL
jgi:hypothetical protein